MSNPLDELASEYVLGTLPGEQRAEVEQRLPHDPELRAAVDAWEQRLLPLTALAAPVTPPPQLWQRIERNLSAVRTPWWDLLALWRGLAGAGLVATLALAYIGNHRAPTTGSVLEGAAVSVPVPAAGDAPAVVPAAPAEGAAQIPTK